MLPSYSDNRNVINAASAAAITPPTGQSGQTINSASNSNNNHKNNNNDNNLPNHIHANSHETLGSLVPDLGDPLPVPIDDPDFDSKYPINNARVSSKLIPLYKPWGHKYSNKLMCMIVTMWPEKKEKMTMIDSTYGEGCDKLVWVVDAASNPPKSYANHDFYAINMSRPENQRNIWEKVHRMWSNVYNSKLTDKYDWFIKADDDTFIITENMKGYLQYYDPNYPHYLGHTLRKRWKSENVIFNSGVCYVLSKASINRIGPYLTHLPTLDPLVGRSHCVDRSGAGEDPTTSICLSGVGIRPGNTLDHEMRERFLIFRPTDHEKIYREDTWYWEFKPPSVKDGPDCCSPYIVCAHNYKDMNSVKKFFPLLQKEYNQPKDWDNIPLPPRPRTFIYDSQQVTFKIDDWFNIEKPPHGQRIFLGPYKPWQCYNCKIGDQKDPFWTQWWDVVKES